MFKSKTSARLSVKTTLFAIKLLHYFKNKKKLNIIDFGGGGGVIYPFINKLSIELGTNLITTVIDSKDNIELGREILGENKNLFFKDESKNPLLIILKKYAEEEVPIVLNLSSVIQYIHPYKEFLGKILSSKIPDLVCITRFQRCEDAPIDAFTIQDITSDFGYCGSTVVNLFSKQSLENTMNDLGYKKLKEEFPTIGNQSHFDACEDISYKRITSVAYVFVKE